MLLADIEDDEWYKIEPLSLHIKGTELQKPEVIRSIRELVRRHEEEVEYNQRCFPNRDNIQVFQISNKPPAFYIHPNFEGVRQVAKDLGISDDLDAVYFLRLFNASEFIKYHKRSVLKFKKYTVEAFGIRIKLSADADIFKWERQPLPNASNYAYPPLYWYENAYHLVQIWRLRIFKCPLENIKVPISDPLTPNIPPVIKFEWRWHPQKHPAHFLYGPHNMTPRRPPKPLSFFKDCFRIIRDEGRRGRPREFPDRDFFIQVLKDAFQRLQERTVKPPSRQLVAEKLEIDRTTLKSTLKWHSVSWPPC